MSVENVIDQIVSGSISIIIGLFMVDLLARTLLGISIVDWLKNVFTKGKNKHENEEDDN